MPKLFLHKGREQPVVRGHPWIFSGAIQRVEGEVEVAGVADLYDSSGLWLARGCYNPKSQIRLRILTWREEAIDKSFFARRLSHALERREQSLSGLTNAYRLINGEGDFLPGLVVDRYGDYLVCQFFTAGMDGLKGMVIDALRHLFPRMSIYERSEGSVREEEGLLPSVGPLSGDEPPELVVVEENQLKFLADLRGGQKTGFYLDQRENRILLHSLSREKAVLNCFSYTGAFGASALKGGARQVISVDSSRPALETARRVLDLNDLAAAADDLIRADVFSYLKNCPRQFDIVVLDPPSLAHRRGDVAAASGSYKFLNLHALRVLRPGGLLLTFSCSQHIPQELFQKIVFGAAVDSGKRMQILKKLGQPIDHPVSLHHLEGEYLKGFLLGVLD
ncbi:MAG: class I SAM-dependent rRNA methyltransferase [Deltaproteobacteria bacterium]|nr:class I SAM-dependent rRNA methyltransferase [Deltaproteobacteria bacterium]